MQLEEKTQFKQNLEDKIAECELKVQRARILTESLKNEAERW